MSAGKQAARLCCVTVGPRPAPFPRPPHSSANSQHMCRVASFGPLITNPISDYCRLRRRVLVPTPPFQPIRSSSSMGCKR